MAVSIAGGNHMTQAIVLTLASGSKGVSLEFEHGTQRGSELNKGCSGAADDLWFIAAWFD